MACAIERTTFGELRRGDRFGLSRVACEDGECLNIKVDSAVLVGSGQRPFNVISLQDGRARTFRDEETVWVRRPSRETGRASGRGS